MQLHRLNFNGFFVLNKCSDYAVQVRPSTPELGSASYRHSYGQVEISGLRGVVKGLGESMDRGAVSLWRGEPFQSGEVVWGGGKQHSPRAEANGLLPQGCAVNAHRHSLSQVNPG